MIGQAYVLYFIILPAIFGLLGVAWLLHEVYVNFFSCQCKDGGFKPNN